MATALVHGMDLPDRRGGIGVDSEQVRELAAIVRHRVPQAPGAVSAPVVACDDRTPGWHAHRCLAIRSLEVEALGRDPVNVRRQGLIVPVASGHRGLVLVGAQEQEVRPPCLGKGEVRACGRSGNCSDCCRSIHGRSRYRCLGPAALPRRAATGRCGRSGRLRPCGSDHQVALRDGGRRDNAAADHRQPPADHLRGKELKVGPNVVVAPVDSHRPPCRSSASRT